MFRTTGSHIRVWGLDDGSGRIKWRALPSSDDEIDGVLHSFEICLECSDGTARNTVDGRLMSVSWPNIGGVRVEVAPAHLERWVAEGIDPVAALAQMADVVPDSDWLRVLRLTHQGESDELDRIATEGAEEETQFTQILSDIDSGRWSFSP